MMLMCAVALALQTPQIEQKTLSSEGEDWHYVWAVPAGRVKALVIGLHGAAGGGEQFALDTRWVEKGTVEGLALACPTGIPVRPRMAQNPQTNPRIWNSGENPQIGARARIDDVAFIKDLIAECKKKVGEVPVFLTGHSNGSGMSFRFARENPGMITAIGVMSGVVATELKGRSPKMIPTLYIAGESDPLVPWNGGESQLPWGNQSRTTKPVLEMLGNWAAWQGLPNEPKKSAGGNGSTLYDFGKEPNLVRVMFLPGQGHMWSGGRGVKLPRSMVGDDASKVDATAEMIAFFKKYL